MTAVIEFPRRTPLRTAVAAEVRALMGRYNVNQTKLADVLGVTQTQVSKRLRGLIPFDVDELDVMAGYFRVSVTELVGGPANSPRPGGPTEGVEDAASSAAEGGPRQIRTDDLRIKSP